MDEATRMFQANDYRWKTAFAFDLHQIAPRLAVEWAILCIREIGTQRFPDQLVKLLDELTLAEQYLDAFPESLVPDQLELEIWHRPDRREIQTAVSKLFSGIRQLHERNNCFMTCGAVVSNLVQDDWINTSKWGCKSEALFDLVENCYQRIRDSSEPIVG